MISSVIAKLKGTAEQRQNTISRIASRTAMETGGLVDGRLLPITIESATNEEMESATRWLQAQEGVEFVDIVYVHFEDTDHPASTPGRGEAGKPSG